MKEKEIEILTEEMFMNLCSDLSDYNKKFEMKAGMWLIIKENIKRTIKRAIRKK